jgi:hypothetical protein
MAPSVAMALLGSARKVLLSGGESAHSLCMRIAARAACRRNRVVFICGDNRFDPYAISRAAKVTGVRPEDALRSIKVARAFTAYQLSELVSRLDSGATEDVVVISGPCSTFFDEDVSAVDAARLFYRMLWRIVELSQSGMTLLLAQSAADPSARRAYFLTDLCRVSEAVMHLDGRHSFTLSQRPGRKGALSAGC